MGLSTFTISLNPHVHTHQISRSATKTALPLLSTRGSSSVPVLIDFHVKNFNSTACLQPDIKNNKLQLHTERRVVV